MAHPYNPSTQAEALGFSKFEASLVYIGSFRLCSEALSQKTKKIPTPPRVKTHVCNPSTEELEVRGQVQAQDQPELHRRPAWAT